jgi:hypothetical protein
MRNLGWILLLAGVIGFFYCGDQVKRYGPAPEGAAIGESLKHPAGRWEVGRYACAFAAGVGALLAMFPKGR